VKENLRPPHTLSGNKTENTVSRDEYTESLPSDSLFTECFTVSHFTRKCGSIYSHEKNYCPFLIFKKLTKA